MPERICVIVNPAAGRGRAARMIPEISARFAEVGSTGIRTTKAKGEEAAIAAEAIAEGFTTLVAVGGDGTTSNIANAILRSGADIRVTAMPAGTGNDFAKLLGTTKLDVGTVARMCADGASSRVDVGRIEDVHFLNSCGFGFDVAVVQSAGNDTWLRGNAVYVVTALRQLWAYRGLDVALSSPSSTRARTRHMLVVFANAAYFGGVFEIAPGASATDGMLDAISITDMKPLRRLRLLAAAMGGRHERFAECARETAPEFTVAFDSAPSYEADGELYHARSATLTIASCPGALRVVSARI